jgi:hypothetical protein
VLLIQQLRVFQLLQHGLSVRGPLTNA